MLSHWVSFSLCFFRSVLYCICLCPCIHFYCRFQSNYYAYGIKFMLWYRWTLRRAKHKQSGKQPTLQDRLRAPPDLRSLFCEWKQLDVGEGGIPCWRSGSNVQLVLPQKFHRTVFRELHEEMGHLGVERVLHLTREWFFSPRMKRDIEHFVTHVCSRLKQRKPH